jgi:hypothetical protein
MTSWIPTSAAQRRDEPREIPTHELVDSIASSARAPIPDAMVRRAIDISTRHKF